MVGVEDYSCGSGGGIYVSVTTLQGSGQITAAGGSGDYGGGGGGRVAVYAADYSQFDLASIQALGGTVSHSSGQPGGAGTVYVVQGVPLPARDRARDRSGRTAAICQHRRLTTSLSR